MIRAGVSQNEVSRRLGVHRNTISALWRRYQQSGNIRDRRRSGRPCATSLRQDTYIRVTHLRNRLQTAALTARSIPGLRNISPRTVRNRLRERNIRPQRPAIRPVLQRRYRVARLAWCRAHLRFTRRDWTRILFSDESRFHLDSSDGRSRVYRLGISPDLSPIEHAWDEMERRLRQLPNQPVTLAELSRALVRIWNGIPQAFSPILSDPCGGDTMHALLLKVDTPDIDFVTWCLRHF